MALVTASICWRTRLSGSNSLISMNWLDCILATSLAGTGSMVGDRIKPVIVGSAGGEVSSMPDGASRVGAKVVVGMGVGRECEAGKLEDQTLNIWAES